MHVGIALINNSPPLLPKYGEKLSFYDDPFGPWAEFFAPKKFDNVPQFLVPKDWAKFFTALLLSPKYFEKAKDFLHSKAFLNCFDDDSSVGFVVPDKCLAKKAPSCILADCDEALSNDVVGLSEVLNNSTKKPRKKKNTVLVESEM